MAGICAATMAARLGARTALVHDRPVLGGNSSSEVRCPMLGADCIGANRHARESGIVEELRLEARFRDGVGRRWYPDWDWLLWEWVKREPQLDLFLNTCATQAEITGASHIGAVLAFQMTSGRRFRLAALIFIDASGDGAIAADAGAEYRFGRESRAEMGESLAPEQPDSQVQPSAISFVAQDEGRPVAFTPPAWARVFATDADLPFRDHSRVRQGYWWLEYGGLLDTVRDAEKIRDELVAILYGIWDHIKNRGDHGADNLSLVAVSPVIGKRESRRFVGDYILTQNDIEEQRLFPDRVAYGGWPFDIHPAEGIDYAGPYHILRVAGYPWGTLNSLPVDASNDRPGVRLSGMGYVLDPEQMSPADQPGLIAAPPGIYSIPFRCLYSKNIENLLLAGRNISASHVALGSTRVIATCATIGQAAGAAAHLCLKHKTTPRGVYRDHIAELQQLLLKHDAHIIALPNGDAADIARSATATASSDAPLAVTQPATASAEKDLHHLGALDNAWAVFAAGPALALDVPRGQQFAAGARRIEATELYLLSSLDQPQQLEVELVQSPRLGDLRKAPVVARSSASAPARGWAWVSFPFGVDVESGVYWLRLPATEGLAWGYTNDEPLATQRSQWYPLFNRWDRVRGTHCFRVTPPLRPYGAANVISGVARPEGGANCWVSDPARPLPQWVELRFPEPRTFNSAYLTFDSDLDVLIARGASAPCVRDYRLRYEESGQWRQLLSVSGNHQRRRMHHFAAVSTRAIRLLVEATNGDRSARVYEVRLYRE